MLKLICEAGQSAGIPVSMCGEMAGDPMNVLVLLGLGLSELSMNSASVPLVKRVLRESTAADGKRLMERLLERTAADDIEREVREEMVRRFPDLLGADAKVDPVVG
jgi:phosphotransferase system enzyme I (PtsI)